MNIILIGCGKEKRPYPAMAQNLYTGNLFLARREYAIRSRRPWAILSAKHGLVLPAKLLEPYDYTLDTREAAQVFANKVYGQLMLGAEGLELGEGDGFELHAGALYCEPLATYLRDADVEVELPVKGLGIGQQLAWYSSAQALKGGG